MAIPVHYGINLNTIHSSIHSFINSFTHPNSFESMHPSYVGNGDRIQWLSEEDNRDLTIRQRQRPWKRKWKIDFFHFFSRLFQGA